MEKLNELCAEKLALLSETPPTAGTMNFPAVMSNPVAPQMSCSTPPWLALPSRSTTTSCVAGSTLTVTDTIRFESVKLRLADVPPELTVHAPEDVSPWLGGCTSVRFNCMLVEGFRR